ncbi:hypothetical protein [Variovorax sp. HJSM1_2]|uniref:hypothetical protein n=1 Tax=Variovorax sp. HJSM1_2 TaxID=3366263 RepID=UPI003BE43B8A
MDNTSALRADTMATMAYRPEVDRLPAPPSRASVSGVSWGAILAGAAGAAALSLIMLILGSGLGLSAISPWARDGVGVETLTISAIAWVIFTQLLAAALGGYLAGRLRAQWLDTQADEIYFRDTAHGFLAWAIASLASAVLLSAVIGSIVGGGAQAAAGIAKAGADMTPSTYVVDSLFRQPASTTPDAVPGAPNPALTADRAAMATEVTAIFMNTIRTGALQPEDQRYVAQLVAQRTGLTEAQATERVREAYARAQTALRNAETTAREAADKARKASATTALWLFIALLSGAFIASLAATFGGRQRDL